MDAKATLLDAFELLEEYLVAHEKLSLALRSGHLHLAQAKYSLPPGTVGRERYPSHMKAAARVISDESKLELSFTPRSQESQALNPQQPTTEVCTSQTSADEAAPEPATDCTSAPGMSSDQSAPNTTSSSSTSEKASKLTKTSPRNPAAWFAPLPPRALHQAQEQFTSALQQAVQLAKCRQRLLKQVDPLAFEQLSAVSGVAESDDKSSADDSSSALSGMIGEALAELDAGE
jgi:hypothetical protein